MSAKLCGEVASCWTMPRQGTPGLVTKDGSAAATGETAGERVSTVPKTPAVINAIAAERFFLVAMPILLLLQSNE
ncbi:MAG: hypothetical protein HYZ38_00345 [Mycobacterium sp.]|nr:hypothetical protein [Mycobacterium sp.]